MTNWGVQYTIRYFICAFVLQTELISESYKKNIKEHLEATYS